MPGVEHEAPLALATLDPSLPAWLAAHLCGKPLPGYNHASAHPGEVRELTPPRPPEDPAGPHVYLSDGMFAYCDALGEPVLGIVFEVQRERVPGRLRRLKLYIAALENELAADTVLLLYCPDGALGQWYRRLARDPGYSSLAVRLEVFTDEDVPVIQDVSLAREHPALAVLSVISHADWTEVDALFPALTAAIKAVGPEKAGRYDDIVRAVLPLAAETRWRAFMTSTLDSEFLSDFYRELEARAIARGEARGRTEGEAHGEAQAVLTVLEARGVTVPAAERDQILACTDLEKIRTWLRRALSAVQTADVIG